MIWQVLNWISENRELLVIIFTAIGLLVKQRYDDNKRRLERDAEREEEQRKRQEFERDEKAKREAHQQAMEIQSANEISKQREWFQARIDHQAQQIETLERRNDEQYEKLGQLSIENSLHKGTIESLTTQMGEMKTQLAELKQEVRHYQTENGQLIDENNRLHDALNEEKQRNKAVQEINKGHLSTITKLNARLDKLDMLVRDHESTIESQSKLIKSLTKDDNTQPLPDLSEPPTTGIADDNQSSDKPTQNDERINTKDDAA